MNRRRTDGPTTSRLKEYLLGALLFLACLGWDTEAHAFEICWQASTENVDGSPVTGISHFDAYLRAEGETTWPTEPFMQIDQQADGCEEIVASPGTYEVALTQTDPEGDESGFSNIVRKVQPGESLPPVIIGNQLTAYTVVKQPDRFVLLPIGVVPAGTSCDPNNSVNGHGAVPTEAVIWTCEDEATCARPVVVVALCDG